MRLYRRTGYAARQLLLTVGAAIGVSVFICGMVGGLLWWVCYHHLDDYFADTPHELCRGSAVSYSVGIILLPTSVWIYTLDHPLVSLIVLISGLATLSITYVVGRMLAPATDAVRVTR